MKASSEVLKTLRKRRRWRPASAPLTLAEYIETLRPTAQALSEALCALDPSGRIAFANLRFQRLLARAESDLIGKSIFDVSSCAALQMFDGASRATIGLRGALARCVSLEFAACEWLWPDGTIIPGRCALRCIEHEGHTLGAMLIARVADERSDGAVAPGVDAPSALESLHSLQAEAIHAERRLRMVETVGDIALAQLPLDELLQALLDGMRREMRLENIAILLRDEKGETLSVRAASGAGAQLADRVRIPLDEALISEAMGERRTIFVPDISQHVEGLPSFTPELRASMNLRSLVLVPLIVEDHVIGAIALGANEPNYFTPDDVRLVELVGERAALAIERARSSDEAARAHERLRFLNEASGELNTTLDYHDTTRRLAAILTPALADACVIYLLEDDGLLRKVATQTPTPHLHASDTSDAADAALSLIIARLQAMVEVSPDDTRCAIGRSVRTMATVFERQPIGADTAGEAVCVAVPLVVRQHALGAIYLARRPGNEFSDGDLTLIQGLAQRAAIAIDTARHYLETEQALASGSATATQLDTIFDATDVGIYVTDADGEFLRINPYGAHLLGLEKSPLDRVSSAEDPPPFELRTPEGDAIPEERAPLRLARTLGRAIEQRVVIHRWDTGKDVQALTRCSPWLDTHNQIAGAIGVFTDITAIYELERQKDEFLGIASHELKTPLTSLKILAQLLGRKMKASGDLRELDQAQHMEVAITRMERLINDLLDVSLIEEGKLALHEEVTDLGDICAEAVDEQTILTQRDIRYSAPKGLRLPIFADPERIYQAVTNLLSNAIKYSPAPEPVTVRMRATAEECIVSVHDHGPGVPSEAIEHIFERFFRVPGMQVQSGSGVGLGLGLNISREIINRHGGRIWVESKLGHGSVFSIALPRAGAAPVSAIPAAPEA